jgi:hypothetical protein
MRKILTSALAAVTFGGAVAATAVPAEARDYYGHTYYRHHHSGDTAAVAVAAGIAGLAIGSALSSSGGSRRGGYSSSYSYRNGYSYDPRYDYYDGDYYDRGYYRPDRICISRERVWDPYIGRHVSIERRYPC